MAKFSGKNIEFLDNQKAIFGTEDDSAIQWDNNNAQLTISTVVSGVDPTVDGHLVTKRYADDGVATLSGVLSTAAFTGDHGDLTGREDDDHLQYVATDGRRGFTSTVSGVDPEEDYDLTTRQYVLGVLDGSIPPPTQSGTVVSSLIQFHYAEDAAESSTNSPSYVQKLRLTCSGLPTGNYRIGWTFQWRHSKSNTEFAAQVQVDDTDQIFLYQASPYVDTLYWQPVTSFYYYDVLVSGTHTIDLDFLSSAVGSTSYIRETKMEFWRIT